MRKTATLLIFMLLSIAGISQTVSDADGNIYGTIVIGNQIWMSSNLHTTHFNNGDLIPTTNSCSDNIMSEFEPKYQWAYNCQESLVPIYGRLYTWYVVADSRNVCPAGWHLPSLAEFNVLSAFLGGPTVAGGKLKETGYEHWQAPNTGATNEYGYNGVPNGHRSLDGSYTGLTTVCDTWTTTEGTLGARDFDLNHDNASVVSYDDNKEFGFAIRCISNQSAAAIEQHNPLSSVSIYPTAAKTILNVDLMNNQDINYQIFSISGQLVLAGNFDTGLNQLSIVELQAGFYTLRLQNETDFVAHKFIRL